MKKFRFLGFIALTALIILGMASCQMATDALSQLKGSDANDTPALTGFDTGALDKLKDFAENGGDLNLSDLTVSWNDGTTGSLTLEDLALLAELTPQGSGQGVSVSPDGEGGYTVTITDPGTNDSYTFEVDKDGNIGNVDIEDYVPPAEPVLTGIRVVAPVKVYALGDPIDISDFEVFAVYDNDATETRVYDFSIDADSVTETSTQSVTVTYEGFSDTVDITVEDASPADPVLTGIRIVAPAKEYTEGDAVKKGDFEVYAVYDNGQTEKRVYGFSIDASFATVVPAQTVTITYKELSDTVNITVNAIPVLTGIEITKQPSMLTYFPGDALDFDGIEVTAYYDIGEPVDVTSMVSYSADKANTVGVQTITVTYEGKSDTFNVTVNAVELSSFEIVTPPSKTSYYVGDSLDPTDLVVKAVYNNGSVGNPEIGALDFVYDFSETGPQTVTVSYGEMSDTFDVTVSAVELSSFEIVTPPSKTSYYVGDSLDPTDLVVKAVYNNGSVENPAIGDLDINYDFNVGGIEPVTVLVTVGYADKEVTFNVTVQAVMDSIYISGGGIEVEPGTTEAELKDILVDKITAHYNNGAVDSVTDSGALALAGYKSNVPMAQDVTVMYKGLSAQITVTVTIPASWVLDRIEVVTPPTLTYANGQAYGQALDLNDLVVNAVYSNGKSVVVSSVVEIGEYDTTALGTETITVSYEGKTDTFDVDYVPIGWTLTNVNGSGGGTGTRTFTILFDGVITDLVTLATGDIKVTGKANNGTSYNGTIKSAVPAGNNAYNVSVDFGANIDNTTITATINNKYGIEVNPHK